MLETVGTLRALSTAQKRVPSISQLEDAASGPGRCQQSSLTAAVNCEPVLTDKTRSSASIEPKTCTIFMHHLLEGLDCQSQQFCVRISRIGQCQVGNY